MQSRYFANEPQGVTHLLLSPIALMMPFRFSINNRTRQLHSAILQMSQVSAT